MVEDSSNDSLSLNFIDEEKHSNPYQDFQTQSTRNIESLSSLSNPKLGSLSSIKFLKDDVSFQEFFDSISKRIQRNQRGLVLEKNSSQKIKNSKLLAERYQEKSQKSRDIVKMQKYAQEELQSSNVTIPKSLPKLIKYESSPQPDPYEIMNVRKDNFSALQRRPTVLLNYNNIIKNQNSRSSILSLKKCVNQFNLNQEVKKIEAIKTFESYEEVQQQLKKAALKMYQHGDKEVAIQILQKMCYLCILAVDSQVYKNLLKIMGDIYLNDLKSYHEALDCFLKLRSLASFKDRQQIDKLCFIKLKEEFYDKELKLYAYQHMAKAYQHMKEYQKAITCYKKSLQLSWLIGETLGEDGETLAYEGIGLQYFYLGKMDKVIHYQHRVTGGQFEAKFSINRKLYMQNYNQMRAERDDNTDFPQDLQILKSTGARKPLKIQNAFIGLLDQKGLFNLNLGSESLKNKDLSYMKPQLKDAYFIATVVLDPKFNNQKWKNIFSNNNIDINPDHEHITLRPGTPLSEIELPSPRAQKEGVLNLPYYQETVLPKGAVIKNRSSTVQPPQRKQSYKQLLGCTEEEKDYMNKIIKMDVPHPQDRNRILGIHPPDRAKQLKIKQREQIAERIHKFKEERRKKPTAVRDTLENKTDDEIINFKDIVRRVLLQRNRGNSNANVNIEHLSPFRTLKLHQEYTRLHEKTVSKNIESSLLYD